MIPYIIYNYLSNERGGIKIKLNKKDKVDNALMFYIGLTIFCIIIIYIFI